MANDETIMTNDERIPDDEWHFSVRTAIRHSGFVML